MPDRSKQSMLEAIYQLTKLLLKEAFKSFTSDRGKELVCYEGVDNKLGIDFYLPMPIVFGKEGQTKTATACLLRKFFSKKRNLAQINDQGLMDSIYKVNSRPRKCLEFNTPFERFIEELNFLLEMSQ